MNKNNSPFTSGSRSTYETSVDSFVTAFSYQEGDELHNEDHDVFRKTDVESNDLSNDDTPILSKGKFLDEDFLSSSAGHGEGSGENLKFKPTIDRHDTIVLNQQKPESVFNPTDSPSLSIEPNSPFLDSSKYRRPRVTSSYYQPLDEAHMSLMNQNIEEEHFNEASYGEDNTFNETTLESINTNFINQDKLLTTAAIGNNDASSNFEKRLSYRKSVDEISENNNSDTGVLQNSQLELDEQNYTHLFIVATKEFDKNVLEEEEDKMVCLSFDIDDLAFVHAIEEAGWGEVTLIKSRKRGWVPLNFFTDAIKPVDNFIPSKFKHLSSIESKKILEMRAYILSRSSLVPLFSACGKFLVNPQRVPVDNSNAFTFDIKDINDIKSGIKKLLEDTGCISRSNDLVQTKPLVRKTRKRLLADWYSITLKADSYKNTTDSGKIVTLESMVFQVIRRAFLFYNIWSIEKQAFENEKRLSNLRTRSSSINILNSSVQNAPIDLPKEIIYLDNSPMATSRLNEINSYLFTYIGLIMGRMDIVEHNTTGCEVLEYVVYQIILLLRELLYISKACSSLINSKYNNSYENNLDHNLDPLLSLVSELVSAVKVFVTKTLQEAGSRSNSMHQSQIFFNNQGYTHTDEATDFIRILSQMTGFISNAVVSCNNYLRVIGDFQLSDEKKFPDFKSNSISTEKFVKICSNSILKEIKRLEMKIGNTGTNDVDKNLSRFSTIRAGHGSLSNQLLLSNEGGEFLKDVELHTEVGNHQNNKSHSFLEDAVFKQFTLPDNNHKHTGDNSTLVINDRETMNSELIFDDNQEMLGGSFRSLVFYLTDELHKPSEFFKTCFLMNFKSFGSSKEFIAHLFARFDTENKSYEFGVHDVRGPFSSRESQIKHRRKLVLKIIQLWLESYWEQNEDHRFLPTFMNFFNECSSIYLPIESRKLMEIVSKLMIIPMGTRSTQLVTRSIKAGNVNSILSKFSNVSINGSPTVDETMVEEYNLATNSEEAQLPFPLAGLGSSNLLSKRHLQECTKFVKSYKEVSPYASESKSLDDMILMWYLNMQNKKKIEFSNHELHFCDVNAMEAAKQLTLIEARLFSAIDPTEFLNGNYLEKNESLGLAPNISKSIAFTNSLSNYVIESIVSPLFSLKVKTQRIEQWIKISLSCLYFKNFNSLASIMIALQSHVLSRLDSIWKGLSSKNHKLFDFLVKIIHPNQNYKVYRNKLSLFVTEAKKMYINNNGDNGSTINDDTNTLIIPFFNLFLQDLTMINEGNNDFRNPDSFRPNKVINIDKYFKVTKVIENVQELQVFIVDNLNFEEYSDKRDSLYLGGKETIQSLPILQEFILYDIWRVNLLYKSDPDRGYELSLRMLPRV